MTETPDTPDITPTGVLTTPRLRLVATGTVTPPPTPAPAPEDA